jgi:LysM repeat protein
VQPYIGKTPKKDTVVKNNEVKTTEVKSSGKSVWTVKKGDTLWSISRELKLKPSDIANANNMDENGTLSIGKVLIIP